MIPVAKVFRSGRLPRRKIQFRPTSGEESQGFAVCARLLLLSCGSSDDVAKFMSVAWSNFLKKKSFSGTLLYVCLGQLQIRQYLASTLAGIFVMMKMIFKFAAIHSSVFINWILSFKVLDMLVYVPGSMSWLTNP